MDIAEFIIGPAEGRTRCLHPSYAASSAKQLVSTFRYLRTGGLVLFQVGTAFVTPTEGQLYDPTDGAVTVPTVAPDVP